MKLSTLTAGMALSALVACSSTGPSKEAAMNTPLFLSQADTIAKQRPALPNTHKIAWTNSDRLYRSVTVDYISGMSQSSYFFAEANQNIYRPMLAWSLDRAGLLAPTPAAARYALQVEFEELDSQAFGRNLAGKSRATYRIVSRRTGETVYEKTIGSNFLAVYPGFNEADAADAYGISKPPFLATQKAFGGYVLGEGVVVEAINNSNRLKDFFDGPIVEASQATWNDVYQTYLWGTGLSLLAGPAVVAAEQINPFNYIAFADTAGRGANSSPIARQGALSTQGIASRNGSERGRQVNAQMLAQGLTKFLITLADSEDVRLTLVLPCLDNDEVNELIEQATLARMSYVTDDCMAYSREPVRAGVGFSNWK